MYFIYICFSVFVQIQLTRICIGICENMNFSLRPRQPRLHSLHCYAPPTNVHVMCVYQIFIVNNIFFFFFYTPFITYIPSYTRVYSIYILFNFFECIIFFSKKSIQMLSRRYARIIEMQHNGNNNNIIIIKELQYRINLGVSNAFILRDFKLNELHLILHNLYF